jgi:hypothetical protein
MSWSEQVYPHGELEQVADRLWAVRGSLPRSPLPRSMLLYRYAPGKLLVHSAVALDPARMQQLEALGTPDLILVPNRMHRLQAPAYAARYPEARVVCPAAARDHVAKLVRVHATAEEALPPLGVSCHAPPGVKGGELVYELPLEGGVALVFTDLLFNLRHLPGVSGWLVRLIGSSGFFGVTRLGRALMLQDRRALAAWLREQAAREDLRVISVAHGERIEGDCGQRLRDAADRLAPA